ncbi:MAG TPA: sigma-70 family RNA polymerase sigma factor [Gemmataceae bacterium]|nr:sigma-70 family RNA polymerase sigma factor [Gemmataceae bacterium]
MSAQSAASELIRRCRDGESGAREQLFARYQHYLHVLAQAQLGKRLRAKCAPSDLVQQTLLEAHRDFGGFQGHHEGELLAWLRRILAHNLFNEVRRYGALQRDADREVSLDQVRAGVDHSSLMLQHCLAFGGPSPSEIAQNHESAAHLASSLARLPEDYQTVLLLRVFEELPAEEVAQRMGRSAGAVRMLQMRALTALRQEMEQKTRD